jgi:hypothetical protein
MPGKEWLLSATSPSRQASAVSADNSSMADEPRWNPTTTLEAVQFDWEHEPTTGPVRFASLSPIHGEPARIGMPGAEVEGVIDELRSGVLPVRLPKLTMRKADARRRRSRKAAR